MTGSETLMRELLASILLVGTATILTIHLHSGPSALIAPNGRVLRTGQWTIQPFFLFVLIAAGGLLVGSAGYLLSAESSSISDQPAEKEADARPRDPEPTDDLLEARRQEWSETADRLANTDQVVYETVLEADGVLEQREIVDRTDKSKATVSRALDRLEAKNLVERKRRGNGNVVIMH